MKDSTPEKMPKRLDKSLPFIIMNGRYNIMNSQANKMKNKNIEKYLYNQVPLKILSYLSLHLNSDLSANEISQETSASKGATHHTLQILLDLDVISREKKGNLFIYRVNQNNSVLKQFKIFEAVSKLQPLIRKIIPYCYKIVLFGSCATGLNTVESDIDLFIKTDNRKDVQSVVNKYRPRNLNIKAAIFDPLEIADSKKEDNVFFEQVKTGIVLWEGKPIHETL